MSNHTCIHCGCVLESGEEYIFDEEYYCKDCLDEMTTICDCCGRRIYTENDEGDSRLSRCGRCYRDFYTACDRCGRLVRNEDAYDLDEEDDTPYYSRSVKMTAHGLKPWAIFFSVENIPHKWYAEKENHTAITKRRNRMDKRFDVIVVGAGNGGLAAAANTAKAGLSTLLLEKHNIPGGCATSFRRGRFEFEPSLHELCSVGTADKPDKVYQIFDDLGAAINWCYETGHLFRAIVTAEDGYDVRLEAGIENFCNSVDAAVPGCKASVRKFIDLKPKLDAATDYIYATKGNPNGLVMLLKHADFMRTAGHSVEEVMTACGIPKKAQNMINTYWGYLGVPTDELNCMHFLNMLYGYMVDGAAMPKHRSHELSLALVDVIQKHGGQVWYNSEVTEFLYNEDGSVAGVVANGEKLYAKEVISNVIPNNVYNMSQSDKIPQHQLKLANAREFGISVATVYLGLDCTAEELGMEDYTVFIMNDQNPRVQYDTRQDGGFYIVNCLNNVIPDSSPEGTCTLFFTMPVFGSDVPKDLTPQNYKKYKNDLAKKYIEDAEKVLGISIMPHIEEISVATPVTFARYLGTPEGTIYGYKLSGWDNLMARIAGEKNDFTIPGLSFCGGHHVRGDGYSSAYIIGDSAAKKVIKKLKGGA